MHLCGSVVSRTPKLIQSGLSDFSSLAGWRSVCRSPPATRRSRVEFSNDTKCFTHPPRACSRRRLAAASAVHTAFRLTRTCTHIHAHTESTLSARRSSGENSASRATGKRTRSARTRGRFTKKKNRRRGARSTNVVKTCKPQTELTRRPRQRICVTGSNESNRPKRAQTRHVRCARVRGAPAGPRRTRSTVARRVRVSVLVAHRVVTSSDVNLA